MNNELGISPDSLSPEEIQDRYFNPERYSVDDLIEAMASAMDYGCLHCRSLHGDEVFRKALKVFSELLGVSEQMLAEQIDPFGVGLMQVVAYESAVANLRFCADALGIPVKQLVKTCLDYEAKAQTVVH